MKLRGFYLGVFLIKMIFVKKISVYRKNLYTLFSDTRNNSIFAIRIEI